VPSTPTTRPNDRASNRANELALRALALWPEDRPLAALVSGPGDGRWSRRSILAVPRVVRCVRAPQGLSPADARKAVERELRTILRSTPEPGVPRSPNLGWIACFSYDLGRILEPTAAADRPPNDDRDWPLAMLCWCPDALVVDHATGAASIEGDPKNVPVDPADLALDAPLPFRAPPRVAPLRLDADRRTYEAAVERCVEAIHAGEIFQANVARRMSTDVSGDARALALAAFRASGAWFGAHLEIDPGRVVLSMSPELFLAFDPVSRRIVSRPIKGTRREGHDAAQLEGSAKDAAELAMIVDLMRNDLGRIARIGSIAVDAARVLETHPTVLHAVAEISGALREDVDAAACIAATFPPGSVTGAPKVRAMRVIDELETARRGPYCGATGILATDGSFALNVAIRTIALSGRGDPRRPGFIDGVLDYWAGCGIVADSEPSSEWEESTTKSEVLLRTLAQATDGQRDAHAR
jgi:para-aminobenzoate synthetase component 1